MNNKQTDKIVNALGVFNLTERVTPYGAERLLKVIPQLRALNEAHKTQIDAALAMGFTVTTLRRYLRVLGWEWNNLSKRRPR
jgi:predicted glycosyltransferase involved in capsule biosynthesis